MSWIAGTPEVGGHGGGGAAALAATGTVRQNARSATVYVFISTSRAESFRAKCSATIASRSFAGGERGCTVGAQSEASKDWGLELDGREVFAHTGNKIPPPRAVRLPSSVRPRSARLDAATVTGALSISAGNRSQRTPAPRIHRSGGAHEDHRQRHLGELHVRRPGQRSRRDDEPLAGDRPRHVGPDAVGADE